MRTDTIHTEILTLVKSHCKPNAVAHLIREFRKAEAFERKLTGAGREKGRREAAFSFAERDNLDQLITLCHASLDEQSVFEVLMGMGHIFRDHGDLQQAESLYTMAVKHGESHKQPEMVGEARMRRGDVYCRQGRWKESTSDLDQSYRIFRELNAESSVGQVENILGTNYATQGKLKKAREYFQRALARFERSQEALMTGTAMMNLGIIHNIMGQYDEALAYYRQARPYFERVGNLKRLAELHHNIGMSYFSKGKYKEANHGFDGCLKLATRAENTELVGVATLGKANAYHRMGDNRFALTLANQALDFLTTVNDRVGIADTYKVKGMLFREMKKFGVAESYFKTSLRLNEELQNRLNLAETYSEFGLLCAQRGETVQAVQMLGKALDDFSKVGASKEVERIRAELATLKAKHA